MSTTIKTPKKLIEVALPLDAINAAAAREKSIRHGHPSTLHLWWARRPLAAARAVIFAQMVNDPGYERQYQRGVNKEKAAQERERLFKIIEDLVKWENTNNEEVLERARAEIMKSWKETCHMNREHPQAAELFNPDKLPAFHDPFAGGGALPLEAQRLGLESYASDLNPVAVTINKAMIEIPPKFAGRSPVAPIPKGETLETMREWKGAQGLAEDVRRYGLWMREQAKERIGHLYPQVEVTAEMAAERPDLQDYVGQKLTVIAWIWARTVKSPHPAFSHVDVPLASTFVLSSKTGKEAWIEPIVSGDSYRFVVRMGKPPEAAKNGTKASQGKFTCLFSSAPFSYSYIDDEANCGRMKSRLMAMVLEGKKERVYISPTEEMEQLALSVHETFKPSTPCRGTWGSNAQGRIYGFKVFGDYFTPRQLVALTTFSDLVQEAIAKCKADAVAKGMEDDGIGLEAGGLGAQAYAEAVGVYLAFAIDKMADRGSSLGRWDPTPTQSGIINTFSRQALPMTWDFAEANPLGDASGNYFSGVLLVCKFVQTLLSGIHGYVKQQNAVEQTLSVNKVVSTDPPYYDNIGYADLSDYFYVWMRRSLNKVFKSLYSTLAVPKEEELVATPYRHGGKEAAEVFFLEGMTDAIHQLASLAHAAFPVTIYYAFKQSETKKEGTSNTGWETFLEAVLKAGFSISGTWPMRTELGNRMISSGTNALASSIVLVCRKRPDDAPTISRREFLRELEEVLPVALEEMTRGGVNSPVAPVDLSQAIIGPGMAVFSKYKEVLEADGSAMTVKTALRFINRFLVEGDFDNDTMFCLDWFESNNWAAGKFGEADVLARAKGTSATGLAEAGVVESGSGEVRLLRWQEMNPEWNPAVDKRISVWEALHQLIRALNQSGESETGRLLAQCSALASGIRILAYRLYTLCERKGWADDARAYNEFIVAWPNIEQASMNAPVQRRMEQSSLI